MDVTHDIIAAVSGPGWKFGLSRILINDEGEGVVFIAGSQEPFATFAVAESSNRAGSRGSGVSEQGDIIWRRRGSSCQYKLAKCKISTETMTTWWENSLAEPEEPEVVELPEEDAVEPEAEPVVEEEPEAEPDAELVPDGSAAVVLEWVDGNTERAQAALDAENEGKQRVGLTGDLEKILAAEELL